MVLKARLINVNTRSFACGLPLPLQGEKPEKHRHDYFNDQQHCVVADSSVVMAAQFLQ
jgi:hypothetical protein